MGRGRGRGVGRERNPKQTLLSAEPNVGLDPMTGDHDLGKNQESDA